MIALVAAFLPAFSATDKGIQCGVASAVFSSNPVTLETALETGKLSFWWNWNTAPNLGAKILKRSFVHLKRGAPTKILLRLKVT